MHKMLPGQRPAAVAPPNRICPDCRVSGSRSCHWNYKSSRNPGSHSGISTRVETFFRDIFFFPSFDTARPPHNFARSYGLFLSLLSAANKSAPARMAPITPRTDKGMGGGLSGGLNVMLTQALSCPATCRILTGTLTTCTV